MSLPFEINNRPCLNVIAKNIHSEHFIIQIRLAFQSVTDGEPSISDDSPQFQISLGVILNIAPCSNLNPISILPVKLLPHPSISVQSSIDGKVYENSFEVTLESIQLDESIGGFSNIPQPTIQVKIVPRLISKTEQKVTKSFHCNYCNRPHPISWESEEHIIPKSLNNRNYTLPSCCMQINNYMANAFEKRVMAYDMIKEIMLLVNPPQKPIFRDNHKISHNLEISRWILPSGKVEFVENSKKIDTNTVKISVKGANGEIFEYPLQLPFTIPNQIIAIPRMAKDRMRYVEKAKKEILVYLKNLSENLSINPDFEMFLIKIGGTFKFNSEVNIDEKQFNHTPKISSVEIEKRMTFDDEALVKLFLKIAWTHAAKQLGVAKLSNQISNWILQYLTEGHILDTTLASRYTDLFSESINTEGERFVFWKKGFDEIHSSIQDIKDQQDKTDLMKIFTYNYEKYEFSKRIIQYNCVEIFDDDLRNRVNEFRFHKLNLENKWLEDRQVTVCNISLFGGLLEGSVIISDSAVIDSSIQDEIITF